ncbi:hypothetical protein [Streptomyces sp. SLBN-8D4]|uniref:hypothetical protein n=1 Tax=Streptomyces sp. SLBN-8D4 TaxID=3377728 RepID=UPI003C7E6B6C
MALLGSGSVFAAVTSRDRSTRGLPAGFDGCGLPAPAASCFFTAARKSSMSKLGSIFPGWHSLCPATDFSLQPCARQIAAAHSTACRYCAAG